MQCDHYHGEYHMQEELQIMKATGIVRRIDD